MLKESQSIKLSNLDLLYSLSYQNSKYDKIAEINVLE